MAKKKRSDATALELAQKTGGAIERALEDSTSRQPRFQGDAGTLNVDSIFSSVYRWINEVENNINKQLPPAYSAHSRKRDTYLMEIWKQESLLSGVINSVMQIDANRAWTLTGGRNSVMKATGLLHRRIVAPDLVGWRHAVAAGSLAFAATDLGHCEELGRDGENGPITALYFLDPTKCELTGSNEYPLAYFPSGRGSRQDWPVSDYMRCVSMPSGQEEYNGLGFCAVSRCLELARIMIAVYQHDQEQLGARMPQGLLILNNISEEQWQTALESRDADLSVKARQYFGGLFVLAGTDATAILTALSTLPKDFNTREFVDLLMYGYALAFGYDPREFWPVSGGQLGTATETETQHVKATGKGGMAYLNTYQEKLMNHVWYVGDRTFYGILPGGVQFDFEQRDDDAALVEASVAQAWANVAKTMQESGAMTGMPLLSREQALTLLVDHTNLIPQEWTEVEEEVKAEDTEGTGDVGRIRRSVAEIPAVRRAIEMNPDEPIIRYSYPANRVQTLWQRGGDAVARRSFPTSRIRRFDPDQPRDESGKWTGGDRDGGDGGNSTNGNGSGKVKSGKYTREDVETGVYKGDIPDDYMAQLKHFALYTSENEGDWFDFVVSPTGEVEAFCQRDGNHLYFIEARTAGSGAGTAIIDKLKDEFGDEGMTAHWVDKSSQGFWIKQGFYDAGPSPDRSGYHDYQWYPEEERAVSDDTGKFDPARVDEWDDQGRKKVTITEEDLELAADLWDRAHPEFAGLLRAQAVTEDEANGNG